MSMWNFRGPGNLQPGQLQPGDRVRLYGTVAFERGGFVRVRLDAGGEALVWRADIEREDDDS